MPSAGCPYPGCALNDWHDGDHVPRMRLVQRYAFYNEFWSGVHPGYCEIGRCTGTAVALYADPKGKGLQVCFDCEVDLQMTGATELGAIGMERAA